MTDPAQRDKTAEEARKQLIREFLRTTTDDVERMRQHSAALEVGDPAAWAEVQNLAHNIAARAAALKLGVLEACAREFEQLAAERPAGATLDAFVLQCTASAIETIALEVAAQLRTEDSR